MQGHISLLPLLGTHVAVVVEVIFGLGRPVKRLTGGGRYEPLWPLSSKTIFLLEANSIIFKQQMKEVNSECRVHLMEQWCKGYHLLFWVDKNLKNCKMEKIQMAMTMLMMIISSMYWKSSAIMMKYPLLVSLWTLIIPTHPLLLSLHTWKMKYWLFGILKLLITFWRY